MKKVISISLFALLGIQAHAQSSAESLQPAIDAGDTAWVTVATALVLLMTIPGLAFFYGGLVRRKNVLTVLMQCLITVSVISILWVVCGYSLAFGHSEGVLAPFIGGFDWCFLQNIGIHDISPYFINHSQIAADGTEVGTIPHLSYVMFQCMFAVITPALIIGAFSERIQFKGFLVFSILWSLFIYTPIVHWFWSSDGWLNKLGALDFAGGATIHINAGIAAIAMAVMLGKRRDYKGHALPPHHIPQVFLGTALLWIVWFGFNAGSSLSASSLSANALLVTHIAAATATLVWVLLDWILGKRPTVVGACTGAIAGLAAITPMAGFVSIGSAFVVAILASIVCFVMVAYVKPKLGYDDTLDAFGVHGVSGIIGTVLLGVLATPLVQESQSGALYGNFQLLGIQSLGTIVTIVFSLVGTIILFKIVEKTVGLRVSSEHEAIGLDETQHGEVAYSNFD